MKAVDTRRQSVYAGNLILINAESPLRLRPSESQMVPVMENSHILMERRAAALLGRLMGEIHGWGRIVPVSGWRSQEEQQQIWDESERENGLEFTKKYVALPGHSEHQTGLAIDLGFSDGEVDFLRPDFPYTGICGAFRKKAARYGFIERYPAGKEDITGIAHEPWHFRFVGMPHAEIISEMDFTLEEYHRYLKSRRALVYRTNGQQFTISCLPADALDALPEVGGEISRMISGNNTDGFIVTMWG